MKSSASQMIQTFTKSGAQRFHVEIEHSGLHKSKTVRGDDPYIVKQKAQDVMAGWNEAWAKRKQKEDAAKAKARAKASAAMHLDEQKKQADLLTTEAKESLILLNGILLHTLEQDDTVKWEVLKNIQDYPESSPIRSRKSPEPNISDFAIPITFVDKITVFGRRKKQEKIAHSFQLAHDKWEELEERRDEIYEELLMQWQNARKVYLDEREKTNQAIDDQKKSYQSGTDEQAVVDYCEIVLSNSEYPDYFPQSFEIDFNLESRTIVVEYQLPALEDLPKTQEITYVKSRNELVEKMLPQSQQNKIFECVIHQIALRTTHELFEADQIDAIDAVVFNGFVHGIDPATGHEKDSCIISVQSRKDEFIEINLANVEPKACIRKLKGVSASKLHELTPIPPIMEIERDDKRFVSSYNVSHAIGGTNIAAMDWEDFEHLVRELFAKEFSSSGGEVKVTQASRDGGIDAIAFDPDPIRGGKIVIQAKRYTNTVDVSAVRDLYGTVMSEGANKGILVTTSDFGPDSYEFCKNKPLALIGGAQLLHLLQKHGTEARIDLNEAKKILADVR